MVTGITERNKLKQELAGLGYSMSYIDDWQPKTTLYRHKASYTTDGNVSDEVGTAVHNVPGNPDYVQKKARIGLFTWEPGEQCECKWCKESFAVEEVENLDEDPKIACDQCDFVPKSENKATATHQLKAHKNKLHK